MTQNLSHTQVRRTKGPVCLIELPTLWAASLRDKHG
uniref:Uncharacterized protein n=1 Tax=Anguilla anguilla TaxID=7936 RepID=A0A0E9R866_ANGAN